MEIREIRDKAEWEGFLARCSAKTFLQSWNWGEFQERMRGKIWRFGVFGQDGLIAVALAVKVAAKRGTFLLIPHGPVTRDEIQPPSTNHQAPRQEIVSLLLEKLRALAREESVSFIRINPIWERSEETTSVFRNLGFRDAPLQMHPEASWKLDLTPPENELFLCMRKTTRYLIRKASSDKDIELIKSAHPSDMKIFSDMHEKVSRRQHFVPFSLEYLESEFEAFEQDGQALLLLGKYQGEIAAGAFVIFWSGIGFYHHAASLPEYARFSLPYLLQWEAIREAKQRGCVRYDFWGYVDPKTQPRHPWAGPTLFKMGFGGKPYLYVETEDLPLSKQYWITWGFEKLRRWRRGL